jgi:hypothetical protein
MSKVALNMTPTYEMTHTNADVNKSYITRSKPAN